MSVLRISISNDQQDFPLLLSDDEDDTDDIEGLEAKPTIPTTFNDDKCRRYVSDLMEDMVGEGKKLPRALAFSKDSDIHPHMWAYLQKISPSNLIEISVRAFLGETKAAIACDKSNHDDLRRKLRTFKICDEFQCPGVYLLMGHHQEDGTNKHGLYAGRTNNICHRMKDHATAIKSKREGRQWSRKFQYVHEVLASPGWTVSYEILATFAEDVAPVDRFLLESWAMIAFKTCW
jgi:hypothetical protein